jgi:hypothetical protein
METTRWEELIQRFKITFTFEHESPSIDVALQEIQAKIFSKEETMEAIPVCNKHKTKMIVCKLMECYNVSKEEYDEEDPSNVQDKRRTSHRRVRARIHCIYMANKDAEGKHWDDRESQVRVHRGLLE